MYNKVILTGRIGNDVELTYTSNGRPYITISLATNRPYKDRDGNWQRATDWHRVRIFGKRAEALSKILRKGDLIVIEGRLTYYTVTDPDGRKRKFAYVAASDVRILTNGKSPEVKISADEKSDYVEPEMDGMTIDEEMEINEDDLPF